MDTRFPTFLNLPREYSSRDAYFKILPIPYDGTVCFGKGTAFGPEQICLVSDQMEYIDEGTLFEFWRPGIETLPPIEPASTPSEEMQKIEETVRQYDFFRQGYFPIMIGGEHSVSAPVIRVAHEAYPDLTVVQFDAHSDLRNQYEPGGKNSHASVMRRVLEITPSLIQIGIRSFSEEDPLQCPEQVRRFITPRKIRQNKSDVMTELVSRLGKHTYITIDMDVFDPSLAPGVGTPEPNGLKWNQALVFLKTIFRYTEVVGADVVETMPLGGNNRVTEYIAARLIAKLMTIQGLKRSGL